MESSNAGSESLKAGISVRITEVERVRLQFLLYYILLELLFPPACIMLMLLFSHVPITVSPAPSVGYNSTEIPYFRDSPFPVLEIAKRVILS